jgi:hypothetical protein
MNIHCEVRFHLQNGPHYMNWQVKIFQDNKKADIKYFDPKQYQLEMKNCKLINKIGAAKRVNAAGVKDVSGWVLCDDVAVIDRQSTEYLEKVYYNPIKDIHWRREGDCGEFAWDDSEYETLVTEGKQVYILEERA